MPTSSSSPSEALGHRIHLLRRKRKWSQGDLAARVGTRPSQISRYEQGDYEPRTDMIGRLAEALETTTDFLITGRDPMTIQDSRLKSLLSRLDTLPEELRSHLAGFLESLVQVHQVTRHHRKAGKRPKA